MRLSCPTVIFGAAVLLGASLATPAAADGWGRGGPHHGWGHRHWGGGQWDDGGAAAAAALGGFAVGAVVGASQQPHYGAYDDECHFVDRPVTDEWGQIIEYRRTQICD